MIKLPKIRFKGSYPGWEQKTVKEVAPLQRGFDLPTTQVIKGNYPVVYSNGIGRYHHEFKVKAPGIVTGRSGTIGSLTYIEQDYWPHNTSLWVTKFIDCEPKFAFYLYEKLGLKRFATGSGVPTLNRNDVHDQKVFIPKIEEQKKIANFLTLVDTKIDQLAEKHRLLKLYKKGVMQQIFSQKVRFKDENGNTFPEWKEKYFGEIFTRVTTKNKENNGNVLTISAQKGLISQLEYFNKSVAAKDVSGYYLLHKGDFAYNKSYSQGYPMGAIKPLKRYEKGVVSTLYICFRPKAKFSESFFEQFFDSGMLNREITKIAQEGARNHGLLNVSVKEFFDDIKLTVPELEEQKKIAQFLQSIDTKIEGVVEKIEQTKQFKKGLLQQMFV
ncbi:restriction endonuclease subunit S [Vibrio splendidus]|uniref:restriction endonuclease subunit S n=1 Tax=Vibrio splendidus TaxID=29497 RepID=UPI000C82A895|nr:restriction endonuclease subunit S [Vibrio splendidus]PMN78609.1 hypothetical protein BCT24_05335 [Vibrio splendidus]